MMDATRGCTSFIVACMSKKPDQLRAALEQPDKPARDHGIPVEWAAEFIKRELDSRC